MLAHDYAKLRVTSQSLLTVNPLHPNINIYIISLILITFTFDLRMSL